MQDRDTNFGQDFVDINIEGTTEPFSSVSHIQVLRGQSISGYPKLIQPLYMAWENSYCDHTIIDSQKRLRGALWNDQT